MAKSYPNAREALLLTSNFVLGELAKVDIKAGGKAPFAFNQTGFVSSLKQEVVLAAVRGPHFALNHTPKWLGSACVACLTAKCSQHDP